MNLGAENRNKVIAAVSLVVIAVVLMATRFSGFFGWGSSSADPPPAALGDRASEMPASPAPRATIGRRRTAPKRQSAAQSLDPTLRTDLFEGQREHKIRRHWTKYFQGIRGYSEANRQCGDSNAA